MPRKAKAANPDADWELTEGWWDANGDLWTRTTRGTGKPPSSDAPYQSSAWLRPVLLEDFVAAFNLDHAPST